MASFLHFLAPFAPRGHLVFGFADGEQVLTCTLFEQHPLKKKNDLLILRHLAVLTMSDHIAINEQKNPQRQCKKWE